MNMNSNCFSHDDTDKYIFILEAFFFLYDILQYCMYPKTLMFFWGGFFSNLLIS